MKMKGGEKMTDGNSILSNNKVLTISLLTLAINIITFIMLVAK